jgi:NitT/TauT family transport system substrate-binding protein
LTAFILLWIVGIGLTAAGDGLAQEKVAYRLKWLINASTAGDVFALDQGFFSKQGMQVAVKAGGPERDAVRELELGYAQFGVASADQVIRALAKGAKVVVLAQLFQVNPLQWIYRADDLSLKRIQDLAGQTVGITYGGNDETIMRALLATVGLDDNQVRLASVRYDYTPFFKIRCRFGRFTATPRGSFYRTSLRPGASAWLFSIRPNTGFGSSPTVW